MTQHKPYIKRSQKKTGITTNSDALDVNKGWIKNISHNAATHSQALITPHRTTSLVLQVDNISLKKKIENKKVL